MMMTIKMMTRDFTEDEDTFDDYNGDNNDNDTNDKDGDGW